MIKQEYEQKIIKGFNTAAINAKFQSDITYRPEFISNDSIMRRKVLVSIERSFYHVKNLRSVLLLLL